MFTWAWFLPSGVSLLGELRPHTLGPCSLGLGISGLCTSISACTSLVVSGCSQGGRSQSMHLWDLGSDAVLRSACSSSSWSLSTHRLPPVPPFSSPLPAVSPQLIHGGLWVSLQHGFLSQLSMPCLHHSDQGLWNRQEVSRVLREHERGSRPSEDKVPSSSVVSDSAKQSGVPKCQNCGGPVPNLQGETAAFWAQSSGTGVSSSGPSTTAPQSHTWAPTQDCKLT